MKKIFVFPVLLLSMLQAFPQQIENVSFRQSGKQVVISYDLISGGGHESFEIDVYYSLDGGGSWIGPLQEVSGDAGKGQSPGRQKKVIWNVLSEIDKLTGEVIFEVRANPSVEYGTFTDRRDGISYRYVTIGKQVWMAENLRAARYADGSRIPLVEGTSAWDALGYSDKAYCYYNNSTANRDVYGALYTWAAAMNGESSSDANPSGVQGVCPDGWHLPSDAEWKELEMYLGMSQTDADDTGYRGTDEGGKLKKSGTSHWMSPTTGATNASGFTALPGGSRYSSGSFSNLGLVAYFWSSTETGSSYAWSRTLTYVSSDVYRIDISKDYGFSVRCVRDD